VPGSNEAETLVAAELVPYQYERPYKSGCRIPSVARLYTCGQFQLLDSAGLSPVAILIAGFAIAVLRVVQ